MENIQKSTENSLQTLKISRRTFTVGASALTCLSATGGAANALQVQGFTSSELTPVVLTPTSKPSGLTAFAPSAPHIQRADVIVSATGRLRVHNQNTGENIDIVYREEDKYLNDSLQEISRFFRDPRNDKIAAYSPYLLDYLDAVTHKIGFNDPVTVISAYRSPETNAQLRRNGNRRVAKNSYHTKGAALDIRLKDTNASYIRKAATSLKAGGVGYYPRSNYLHLDAGPYRQWVA